MDYKVKINEFEGPLDLLLHLIKEANIDIYEIKLEEVTKQYLDYIKAMEELNLSIASEYLVMAAELIEMKSKALLPKNKNDEEDEYEEDPREALIKKLIEYKNYKEVTNKFKELENSRQQIFTKIPSDISEYSDKKIIQNDGEVSVTDLLQALENVLQRQEYRKPIKTKITVKEYSVKDRVKSIRKILKSRHRVVFHELFDIPTREYIVVTFLSILEMAKKQEVVLKQIYNFDKIYVELRGSE